MASVTQYEKCLDCKVSSADACHVRQGHRTVSLRVDILYVLITILFLTVAGLVAMEATRSAEVRELRQHITECVRWDQLASSDDDILQPVQVGGIKKRSIKRSPEDTEDGNQQVELLEIWKKDEKSGQLFAKIEDERGEIYDSGKRSNILSDQSNNAPKRQKRSRKGKKKKVSTSHLYAHRNILQNDLVYTNWMKEPWSTEDYKFDYDKGRLNVTQNGIYLVYGQVLFQNSAPHNGFTIERNTGDVITKCIESVDYVNDSLGSAANAKIKTCSTVTVAELEEGDSLYLRGLYANRTIKSEKPTMYWGLVRMAPTSMTRGRRSARNRRRN